LVQAFLKKWWVESDFKAPNLPFSVSAISSWCIQNILAKEKLKDNKEGI
jgi:hypothetical protein